MAGPRVSRSIDAMTLSRFELKFAGAAVVLCLAGLTAACQGQAPPPAATTPATPADPAAAAREKLIARAQSLELPTAYAPPPGDALSHHTSGFAKTMCSAVFVTGYDIDFAAEHVGSRDAP